MILLGSTTLTTIALDNNGTITAHLKDAVHSASTSKINK